MNQIKYFKPEEQYRYIGYDSTLSRDLFLGNFGTVTHHNTYYMYNLDEVDQKLVADIKLRPNEIIVRIETDKTRKTKTSNLVKLNVDKFLVYFNEINDFGDESIVFATRGTGIRYINMMSDKMSENNIMNFNQFSSIR
jgi:hypothetical protein